MSSEDRNNSTGTATAERPTAVSEPEATASANPSPGEMVDTGLMSFARRAWMLFVTRGVFRTCEVFSNHAARISERGTNLAGPTESARLAELNEKRMQLQGDLNRVGGSHGHVCAECKGRCCHGPRERDAFTDRVIQHPDTEHRCARRLTGEQVAYRTMAEQGRDLASKSAKPEDICCPELTVTGCRIPYELRPIQCVAYFCGPVVKELSSEECRTGTRAVAGLMRIQLAIVGLAIRSRFRHP